MNNGLNIIKSLYEQGYLLCDVEKIEEIESILKQYNINYKVFYDIDIDKYYIKEVA